MFIYIFFLFLVVDIIMEVKTICYVVQYAVHAELCSTNPFFFLLNFLLLIGTFFNKILLKVSTQVTFMFAGHPQHRRLNICLF